MSFISALDAEGGNLLEADIDRLRQFDRLDGNGFLPEAVTRRYSTLSTATSIEQSLCEIPVSIAS